MSSSIKIKFERFEHNGKGYVAVLRSDEVRADLQRRADAVKERAEASFAGLRLIADTNTGKRRAGATVLGVPMRIEKARRILGRAIDAAR